jgi:hypothetical protein
MYVHNNDDSLSTHPLASCSCFILPLSYDSTLLFTYLEILFLLLVVRIPIHSCPWIAVNCSPLAASSTPRHPIDQVTYLHRQHQQHQPSRLTQIYIHLLSTEGESRLVYSQLRYSRISPPTLHGLLCTTTTFSSLSTGAPPQSAATRAQAGHKARPEACHVPVERPAPRDPFLNVVSAGPR